MKIEIYEGVIYRENFRVSFFKKTFDNLFELRRKYKDVNNGVMQLLVKFFIEFF